jgi:hypothetical protein
MQPKSISNVDVLKAMMLRFFLALSCAGSMVGVLVKPSLLRETETSTKRWISTRGMMKFFNGMRYSSDRHILGDWRIARL